MQAIQIAPTNLSMEKKTNSIIDVWFASLDQPPAIVAEYATFLSADEQDRADRYAFARDSRRFIVGRGLLRILLAQLLDIAPQQVAIMYGQYGKPKVANNRSIQFNLSNSEDIVLVAIGDSRRVGIDIEYKKHLPNMGQIVDRFFSPRERYVFHQLPAAQRQAAFYYGWTRKEAYIKAIGEGLSCPLHEFDVTIRNNVPVALLAVRHGVQSARRWSLKNLDLWPDYAAAIVAEGNDWAVRCREWTFAC